MQTEEEQLLDKFTDDLYNGTNGTNEDGMIDPAALAQTMEEDCDIDKDVNDDDDKSGNNNSSNDNGGNGNGDGSIVRAHLPGIGEDLSATIRVCANVKKCAVNEIVLNQDVIGYAKGELEKLNLEKTRVCKRARRMRMKALLTAMMDSISSMNNGDDDSFDHSNENRHQYLQSAFQRLNKEILTGGEHEIVL